MGQIADRTLTLWIPGCGHRPRKGDVILCSTLTSFEYSKPVDGNLLVLLAVAPARPAATWLFIPLTAASTSVPWKQQHLQGLRWQMSTRP
jgi:hypothetical protein